MLLQCNRETPQEWVHSGALRWAARNGSALGCGAFTRIGFPLWYVVPAGAFLIGSPLLGGVLYGAYGGTRGLGAVVLALRTRVGNLNDVADALFRRNGLARRVAACQLMVVAVTTVVGVGF